MSAVSRGYFAACVFLFAAAGMACADDPLLLLLTHPETAFVAALPGEGLSLSVDDHPSMTGPPTLLLRKSGADADFIAAAWNDAQGNRVHQREVFVVKPFYGLVVDHLFGPAGVHTVVRRMILPADGKAFQVQDNGDPKNKVLTESKDDALTLEASFTLPAPVSTVFVAGTPHAPKVTYVKAANPMVVKASVRFADGREDEIAVAWEARPLHVGGKALQGWAACASKGPGGEKQIEIRP